MRTVKAAANSISDVDLGKRTATTRFATYNSLDRDKDRSFKGMFTKSWNEFQDTRVFLNHDKTLAPGKIYGDDFRKSLWEDDKHAYAKMWFGTHTLGDDTLKMMDEGIIKDSSFWFVPIKYAKNAEGGYDLKEVFQKDVSVLTHWGAHPESKIVSVQKSFEQQKYFGTFDPGDLVTPRPGMAHMPEHEGLKMTIYERVSYEFYSVRLPDGSIHKWYRGDELIPAENAVISMPSDMDMKQLTERLTRLKSFCKNTTASDDTIKKVLKEAEGIEALLMMADTSDGTAQPVKQSKSNDDELALLNLKLLLS